MKKKTIPLRDRSGSTPTSKDSLRASANCPGAGDRPSDAKAADSDSPRTARQTEPVRLPGVRDRPLSREDRQMLTLIVNGFTDKEMAGYLCLSESTIRRRVAGIRAKLGAANRFELVLVAVDGLEG